MLGEPRKGDTREGDYIEFVRAGAAATGEYRCSDCGYGVMVQVALPACPMCAGTNWEAAASSPFPRRLL